MCYFLKHREVKGLIQRHTAGLFDHQPLHDSLFPFPKALGESISLVNLGGPPTFWGRELDCRRGRDRGSEGRRTPGCLSREAGLSKRQEGILPGPEDAPAVHLPLTQTPCCVCVGGGTRKNKMRNCVLDSRPLIKWERYFKQFPFLPSSF